MDPKIASLFNDDILKAAGQHYAVAEDRVCFKRVERRNVPKVLPRNFAAFAATFGTVPTEMKHTPEDKLQLLDGFESFIYEFARPDGEFILRIGHSDRRSPDLIRGEVDWINYLAQGGVTVARAVLSQTGKLVEPIEDGHGGQFLCTAFVKARGKVAERDQINDRLFLHYGRLLGRMHALAKTYTPSDPFWKRYAWDDPENNTPDRQLPASEKLIA
jgi:Ser/Thr protein kinase RdoA (MazF antagonist)